MEKSMCPGESLADYGPGTSPVRSKGDRGVRSPKKRNTSLRLAEGLSPGKDEKCLSNEGIEYIPRFEDDTEEETFIEFVDESTGWSTEEEVEVLEKETAEMDSGRDDSESSEDFEPLPPPIEIPDELRPTHLRHNVPAGVSAQDYEDDSSIYSETTLSSNDTSEKRGKKHESNKSQSMPWKEPLTAEETKPAACERVTSKTTPHLDKEPKPSPSPVFDQRPSLFRGFSIESSSDEFKPKNPYQPPIPSPTNETDQGREQIQERETVSGKRTKPRYFKQRSGSEPQQDMPKLSSNPSQSPDGDDEEEEDRKIAWEKPDWARSSPLKKMGTPTRVDNNNIEWEKPDWAMNSKLRGTEKGEKVKSGANLARNIGGIKLIEN